MQKNESRFTVFFDTNHLWVGVYERISAGKMEVCKVIFGAEPKDYEVKEFLLNHWNRLQFSPEVPVERKHERKINPKRIQKLVKKQTEEKGIGTKSQQALSMQREEQKILRRVKSRKKKEEEKQYQFELKQQKRKEKHKGR